MKTVADKSAASIGICAALLGLALPASAAPATSTEESPYRLSGVGAEQRRYWPAAGPLDDAKRAVKVEDDRPFARQIAIAARESGLDPELVHAVIAVESGYQPAAVSPKGAIGLMQVLPETAKSNGVRNPHPVDANLRAGTRYLSRLLEQFDHRLDLALAAYNAGEGAVRSHNDRIPPYPETRRYVPAVVAKYRERNPGQETVSVAKPVARTYMPGTRFEPAARPDPP